MLTQCPHFVSTGVRVRIRVKVRVSKNACCSIPFHLRDVKEGFGSESLVIFPSWVQSGAPHENGFWSI